MEKKKKSELYNQIKIKRKTTHTPRATSFPIRNQGIGMNLV